MEICLPTVAVVCHEVIRAFRMTLGDMSMPPWSDAPDWQKESAMNGVENALDGATVEQMHEAWMDDKRLAGWTFGPVKDGEAKTHPCMVPYICLPAVQKTKDYLFLAVVAGFTEAERMNKGKKA